MHAVGGLLIVLVLGTALVMGGHWQQQQQAIDEARRTAEGFLSLVEGIYAYRTDKPTSWPANFNEVLPYFPNLQVDGTTPTKAGVNGEGGRYDLVAVTGGIALQTVVSNEAHANAVVREFGTRSSARTITGGVEITVGIPDPGGISVMTSALLTDGTNRMRSPLYLDSTVVAGGTCSDTGLGMTSAGELMKCVNSQWVAN